MLPKAQTRSQHSLTTSWREFFPINSSHPTNPPLFIFREGPSQSPQFSQCTDSSVATAAGGSACAAASPGQAPAGLPVPRIHPKLSLSLGTRTEQPGRWEEQREGKGRRCLRCLTIPTTSQSHGNSTAPNKECALGALGPNYPWMFLRGRPCTSTEGTAL